MAHRCGAMDDRASRRPACRSILFHLRGPALDGVRMGVAIDLRLRLPPRGVRRGGGSGDGGTGRAAPDGGRTGPAVGRSGGHCGDRHPDGPGAHPDDPRAAAPTRVGDTRSVAYDPAQGPRRRPRATTRRGVADDPVGQLARQFRHRPGAGGDRGARRLPRSQVALASGSGVAGVRRAVGAGGDDQSQWNSRFPLPAGSGEADDIAVDRRMATERLGADAVCSSSRSASQPCWWRGGG